MSRQIDASNEAVFANAFSRVANTYISTAGRAAGRMRKKVEEGVDDYVDKFYADLVSMGMNVDQMPPPLAGFTGARGEWAPLSEKHSDFKMSKGFNEGFYSMTGGLSSALSGRSASADFGKSKVTLNTKGKGKLKDEFSTDSGILRWVAGQRDSQGVALGGRFAGDVQAYKSLSFKITVQLFPKLTARGGKTGREIFKLMGATGAKAGKNPGPMTVFAMLEFGAKGKGKRILPARPLMRPFIDWYSTTNLALNLTRIVRSK